MSAHSSGVLQQHGVCKTRDDCTGADPGGEFTGLQPPLREVENDGTKSRCLDIACHQTPNRETL